MKFSHFFIDRPIFSTVLSILVIIVGSISYFGLPVAQYPEIAPPNIQVTASYPGADALTVSKTVAAPIEQEINGVENMIYMLSQSTNDGNATITITFKPGTNLDQAQVLVQNRVAAVEPRLPDEVRRIGIITRKNSPDLMMVVNLFSPDDTYDQIYIANYATLQIRDALARIDGVGSLGIYGASQYAMRIWLDPDLTASFGLSAGDVLNAIRSQNAQVAGGAINKEPIPSQNPYELSIQVQGRLESTEEFENIIIKTSDDGRIVRLKDIGHAELGAETYLTKGYLGNKPAIAIPIFQRPGTNAIETSDQVIEAMKELGSQFPEGLEYTIVYNPTKFVEESIVEVLQTIFAATLLVVLVIMIFLQTWRASVIPIIAIPVSLIGTFAVMQAIGFSLNSLTLFGMVLSIGVVVDDAIVVIENMERNVEKGIEPKIAAKKTMDEVGGAIIATTLVLIAVFLPTAFIQGISGQFYRQFGITISVATIFSSMVSLTLSPSMAALLLRKKETHSKENKPTIWRHPIRFIYAQFNRLLDELSVGYGWFIKKVIRLGLIVMIFYGLFIGLTAYQYKKVPTGFIPAQDQGYFIVVMQLSPGTAISKTDAVVLEAINKILPIEGVMDAVSFTGLDGATFTNASNSAVIFTPLDSFEERKEKGLNPDDIKSQIQQAVSTIEEAFIIVIAPPPVRGMGTGGGFKMMIQDRAGLGSDALKNAAYAMMGAAFQEPTVTNVFTFFNTDTPQIYLDIDRVRAEKLGVSVSNVFETLSVFLGSAFVNEFNYLGRTFRVTAQADAQHRLTQDDITRLRVRNSRGEMVPMGSIARVKDISGPSRVPRYNLYPAVALQGETSLGFSSAQAIAKMEELAANILPEGISYEWTELAYQQKQAGNTAIFAFILAIVFVFLLLSAQYESWILPLAIIMVVPMSLFPALFGVELAGMDNNILTQIGLVVLIALASKNAILIVEFAKQLEDQGKDRWEAALEASKLRLRPILMTAFSFILGVLPLVLATGAGSEMRRALGTTVFSGMIGVTIFGLMFTPVFYVLCRSLAFIGRKKTS